MNDQETAWDEAVHLIEDARQELTDLWDMMPTDHVPPTRDLSEDTDLIKVERRVNDIQRTLDDFSHKCAFLRGYEAMLNRLPEDDTSEPEERVAPLVEDEGNVLRRCTCGTASCFEIGQSFAHKWLHEGVSARKIAATIKSRAFYIYCQTSQYSHPFCVGVAQWLLENGEETQATSYDWNMWAALRDFFIKTRYLPDQKYTAPARIRAEEYQCSHEGCVKERMTLGKYETVIDTHK